MFEDKTFENILQEMLDKVSDDTDKRAGSIIYDALAPAALKLEQVYAELDNILELVFAQTSNGPYLERRAAEFGVYRKQATKAVRSANFNIPVNIGERFFIDDLYYVVIDNNKLECETIGSIGNKPVGELLPVNNIPGLETAELTGIVKHGTDSETDEELLNRLLLKVQRPNTSGNIYDYKMWALETNGISDTVVFPEIDGPGTVKVVVIDNNKRKPDENIVDTVREYIEEKRPIGAKVTVIGAEEVPINISAVLELSEGASLSEVKEEIEKNLTEYLKYLAYKDPIVRYIRIANLILDIPYVIDFSNLLVNGETKNIEIKTGDAAVPGVVNVNAS